jgi:hypothetical protein
VTRKENMSGLSPLNGFILSSTVCLVFSTSCFAAEGTYRGIDDDRTGSGMHGLYEIREEARIFVAKENAKNHTEWIALDPNLKTVVPECAVPLKTKWVSKNYGMTGKNVWVICEKTVNPKYPKWSVPVPVDNRPRTR